MREIGLDTAFRIENAMGTYVKYARHRVFNPKPPSERSQNPKTWGNWEGIGDFCLQKCQRGRQLSPLSEATSLVSAAGAARGVFKLGYGKPF